MKHDNIETVKRLDFDRLDTVVSERIGALKLLAQGMTEREVNDEICRDLILPCVYTLAQFLESVKIEERNGDRPFRRVFTSNRSARGHRRDDLGSDYNS